jgi:Phosphate-selective porin O and P
MRPIIILLFLGVSHLILAQDNKALTWAKKIKEYDIQPIIGLQLWSTYTMGMEVYNPDTGKYEAVDNRINTQLRRARLGVEGQPYKNLYFNITTAIDLVGKDVWSATQGTGNNGGAPSIGLLNAFVQWKVLHQNDVLHLTAGYLLPQIGRESITPALRSTSMEKAWSQNYLRRQLTGTGQGRAAGLNVGGLLYNADQKVSWSYDLGLFNPIYEANSGNSTPPGVGQAAGKKFSPLLVGRAVLHIGDPEFEKYGFRHKINYMGKRKGLSLALAGAYQGENVMFKKQVMIGTDLLFNWGPLNLDGEWTFLSRSSEQSSDAAFKDFEVHSNTGYLRLSYNLTLPNERMLEPVVMLTQFNGAMDSTAQAQAAAVNAFSGKDYTYDVGLNYYLNPDFKLSLHYTFHKADSGDAQDGATFNNYFYQGGLGAIHRGDWLGLGVGMIF